jgi:acyl-CoA synthetase (AMP-forming)/AMP-acid ligase II
LNLAMLLDLPAMIVPDEVVLIDTTAEGGRREVTYGELRENVSKVAGLLTEIGVTPGDRVGVWSTNRTSVIEALFGAAAVGATIVPMNFRAGAEEAAHLLADSGTKVLFTEGRYRELLEGVRPGSLERVVYLDDPSDYDAARDAADENPLVEDVDDDELAALLYTSGTTSLPKGVRLKHGALTGYVMGTNDAADGTDQGRMLLAAPLYHIAGLTSLLNALYSGRVTIVLPQFDCGSWLRAVADMRITHAFLVPTMLARLLDDPDFASADLSSLEAVTYGAAPMPPSVIRRAIDAFPSTVSFAGAYGQTETTSTVAVLDPDDHRLEGSAAEVEAKLRRLRSVGRVLDDVELRVVDEMGQPVEPNVRGEVQLRTFRAMDGYWGNEEKTRVTIDDEGWVHTGDLGYLDEEDYLFLEGRTGDMIIRGGENVSPEEVEAILYEHPDVLEAGVVGRNDETWGEVVVAAAVVRAGSGTTAEDLITHARERLAPFKRPEEIRLVEELPRTSTGKLLRRELLPMFDTSG